MNSQITSFCRLGGSPGLDRTPWAGLGSAVFGMVLAIFLAAPVHAQKETGDADPFSRFGNYTEGSDLSLDHGAWDELLDATVIVIKSSGRVMASSTSRPSTGTKISRGSGTAARMEGNRVLFHMLKQEHLDVVDKYRRDLELIPTLYPLADFSKDEQLAYWLNLHNATLYQQLADRYPLSRLKTLRMGRRNQPSLWDEKLLTVEGVALSLRDIQDNILIRHWKSPMVLYGLYQGAIGGPSLPNKAFTAQNVHAVLRNTARDFVNSNRGMKMWSGKARVSRLYEWGAAAFPDWEKDILDHLAEFTNRSRGAALASATGVKANLYDWSIADTKDGTLSAGPVHTTAGALLTMGTSGSAIRGGIGSAQSGLMKGSRIIPGTGGLRVPEPRDQPEGSIEIFEGECADETCPAGNNGQ